MSSNRLRRVVGVLSSSMLAFLLLGPASAVAAPASPDIQTNADNPALALIDQNGIYDPATGKFASGWFDVVISNPGTSAYTQIVLTVEPSDTTKDLVARYAHDGTAGAPSAIPAPTASEIWPTSCLKYDENGVLQTADESGWTFVCTWSVNLPGGSATPPIRFVYAAPTLPQEDVEFTVTASIKSRSTSGSGGSGEFEDATSIEYLNADFKETADGETTYRVGATPQTILETFREGKREGVSTTALLPASQFGYSAALQDLAQNADTPCSAAYEAIDSPVPNPDAQLTKLSINGGAVVDPYLKLTIKATWPKGSDQPAKGAVNDAQVLWCRDDGTWASIGKTDPGYGALDGYSGHFGPCATPKKGSDYVLGPEEACFISGTEKLQGKFPNGTTTWTVVVLLPHNGFTKMR